MKYYIADVFTEKNFGGNPAGVCLLEDWLPDETLQNIAAENNLSETAFLVKRDGYYDLRWFTPQLEVDLCGHATMGSSYILFRFVETNAHTLEFHTLSGTLTVERKGDMLWMDFPARPGVPVHQYRSISKAFGIGAFGLGAFGNDAFKMFKSADLMVVVDSEETVKNVQPDLRELTYVRREADMPDGDFGVIVTAPGSDCDFVSRFFAPDVGIDEDPVTGRAHCVLTPYWSKRLGKTSLTARQLSKRGGFLLCEDAGERVKIGGKAVLYLSGEIMV